ncbi:hypothetical protein GCM10009814_40110 [Lapillicoccus jejuensis]
MALLRYRTGAARRTGCALEDTPRPVDRSRSRRGQGWATMFMKVVNFAWVIRVPLLCVALSEPTPLVWMAIAHGPPAQ